MFINPANPSDCWKFSLQVEWHDCSWCPSIGIRQGWGIRWITAIKPLPNTPILKHPDRSKNHEKPMNKIGNQKSTTGSFAAFTLVELLVVIAIIGILAAMLLPVLATARKAALKTKAKTEIADIVNAINAYDTDNSRFPVIKPERDFAQTPPGNDFTTGMVFGPGRDNSFSSTGYSYDNNSNVMAILVDLTAYPNGVVTPNANHVYNPKQVKYLNAKPSGYTPVPNDPNALGGLDNTGVYRDPWGNPYIISMDLNYDEQCSDMLYSLDAVSGPGGANTNPGLNGLSNPDTSKNNNFQFHGKVMVWSAGPDKTYDPTVAATAGKNKDNIVSWAQ